MAEEINCCIGSKRKVSEIEDDKSTLQLTGEHQQQCSKALSPEKQSPDAVVLPSKADCQGTINSSDFKKSKWETEFDPNQENPQVFEEHMAQLLQLADEKENNLKQFDVNFSEYREGIKNLDLNIKSDCEDFDEGLSGCCVSLVKNQFLEGKDGFSGSETERNLKQCEVDFCEENKKLSLELGSVSEDFNWGMSDSCISTVLNQFLETKNKLLFESDLGLLSNSNSPSEKCTEINDSSGKIEGIDEKRCALKIEVIDDIAVIETAVVRNKQGNVKGLVGFVRSSENNGNAKNLKQEANEGKKKRPRRKGKGKRQTFLKNGEEKALKRMAKAEYGGGHTEDDEAKNKDMAVLKYSDVEGEMGESKAYSRQEMEALRFAEVERQRTKWLEVYSGLGHVVAGEYDGLLPPTNQKHIRLDFDSRRQGARKAMPHSVLDEVCSKKADIEFESAQLMDLPCALSFSDAGDSTVVEGECSEDDDSDGHYSSIRRPAFLVTGEPDFDSGPPEDGLEYLRHVRWEAAQIPKVKMAKVDRNKLKSEQTIYMPSIPEIAKCPEHLLPTKQWEDAFLADFSELRLALACHEVSSGLVSSKLQACTVHEEQFAQQPLEGIILDKIDDLINGEINGSQYRDGLTLRNPNTLYTLASDQSDGSIASQDSTPKSASEGESGSYRNLSIILKMYSVSRVSMLKKRINSLEPMNEHSVEE